MAILITEESSRQRTVVNLVYYFFGLLDILLIFRLILKVLGASATSGFVNLIYTITKIFIMPFEGIFRRGVAQGIETTSILEPATIVALIVYAILAWGIVVLIRLLSGKQLNTDTE
ncbi:YggT family protein [Candidatus Woesebacteria bacterium]|nr:YggT family protein [Candidatus Woesebacteria bacterium]